MMEGVAKDEARANNSGNEVITLGQVATKLYTSYGLRYRSAGRSGALLKRASWIANGYGPFPRIAGA